MDTKALLQNDAQDGIYYDEIPVSEDGLLEKGMKKISSRPSKLRRFMTPLLLYGSITFLYSLILVAVVLKMQSLRLQGAGLIYSPAREAVHYEARVFDMDPKIESPYFGEPSEALDEAWNDLLQYQNLYVEAEDLQKLGVLEEGVKLPNGGYYASLMVYHQLHCLKRLHHYFYEDHYFPNITEKEKQHDRKHNVHCLDLIRQGLQCQGDITLLTMRWGKHQAIPLGNFSAPHECVNWDRLQDWSKERSMDMFAEGVLVHPVYGASFPEGQKHRIGVAEDE